MQQNAQQQSDMLSVHEQRPCFHSGYDKFIFNFIKAMITNLYKTDPNSLAD